MSEQLFNPPQLIIPVGTQIVTRVAVTAASGEILLMRTGAMEANLVTLNEEFRLPYISELIARKLAGPAAILGLGQSGQVWGVARVVYPR